MNSIEQDEAIKELQRRVEALSLRADLADRRVQELEESAVPKRMTIQHFGVSQ